MPPKKDDTNQKLPIISELDPNEYYAMAYIFNLLRATNQEFEIEVNDYAKAQGVQPSAVMKEIDRIKKRQPHLWNIKATTKESARTESNRNKAVQDEKVRVWVEKYCKKPDDKKARSRSPDGGPDGNSSGQGGPAQIPAN